MVFGKNRLVTDRHGGPVPTQLSFSGIYKIEMGHIRSRVKPGIARWEAKRKNITSKILPSRP